MQRILTFLLILTLFFMLFLSQTYRLLPRKDIPPAVLDAMNIMATKALELREVPVGAVLTYGDSIIGMGYNTVARDTLLSGHAEINALNDAHKKYGMRWKSLDCSKLTLYSTYEPCEMCKGAMLNLNIRSAIFEGPKPAWNQVKATLEIYLYEVKKRRVYAPEMQHSLFKPHPDYKGQ